MSNRELLYSLRAKVIRSVYWGGKLKNYYEGHIYRYAPMIKDELFNSLFGQDEVVGVLAMEEKLGRSLKIEELYVSPLSVEYLTLGNVIITESEEERRTLEEFEELIDTGIRQQEGRFVTKLIRELKIWQQLKYGKK